MPVYRPPRDPYMPSHEPLMRLGGAGEQIRRDRSYYYNSRHRLDRPHVVLQVTLEGCGFYRRGSQTELLTPNRGFIDLIPGAFEYGYSEQSAMSYRFYFVTLAGAPAMRWMRRIHDTFGRVLDFGQDRSILDQMGAIVSTQDLSPGLDRYQASAMLYALLMQIHSVLMRSKIQRTSRVHQAMSMIDERSGDPRFNVLTIARMLDCSREHLARQFQQATGMTAVSYLSQYRLRRAAELLRQGDAKLDVIARESGFSGANYLCRLFRQKWGVTPAQYRSTPGMVLLP